MKRIAAAFERRRRAQELALIPYLTAGDPSPDLTPELVWALEEAGADLVELGVPHSDPLADGATNQRAAARALAQGVTLERVMEMARVIRTRSQVPLILFSYYNPILRMGLQEFARRGEEAGVDGAVVTDLPAEEAGELRDALDRRGQVLVPLLAPTSGAHRTQKILSLARGFVYYVSRTGVTGARAELAADLRGDLEKLRSACPVPLVVGFGISLPEHVRALAGVADGVVVGSALVERVEKAGSRGAAAEAAGFMRSLADARAGRGSGSSAGAPAAREPRPSRRRM
jgi:tryptophan synthase alpha chain